MDTASALTSPTDPQEARPTPTLADQDLFIKLKKLCLLDLEKTREWRADARKEFAFVPGPGQWTPAEVQKLNDESRPVVTFNKTLKFVRAICGLEANNRQDVVFLPRDLMNPGKIVANEMLSQGSEWMAEGCDAPAEQSRAFRDATICGMGWTDAVIEYDIDPQGAYVERRVDPLEMFWDTSARDTNLRSSKRRGRVRKMTLAEARALIPGVTDDTNKFADEDLDASWAANLVDYAERDPKTQQEKERRDENSTGADDAEDTDVHIVQLQWWEYEPYFRTVDLTDPTLSKIVEVTPDQMAQLEAQYGRPLPKQKGRRRVYKEAILGGVVLYSGPCKRGTGFTFNCITWEPDDSSGMWFGIVRGLMDPQSWCNKFFSQLMHMINSTAKGGIMAEEAAFSDVRQAEKSFARTNQITIVANGALQKGLIQPKPGAAIMGGVIQLAQSADAAFTDVSGVNLELLGLADRDQAGVLEAQRKQAAITILATLFDGYRGFQRDVGETRLYYLQNYLADNRLIRIKGADGYQAIALIRDKLFGRYDVIVDDAPTSPNAKERIWATLQPFMPMIAKVPQMVVAVLDYIPHVPEALILTFKKILSAPPPQEATDKAARDAAEQQSVIDKNTAAASADNAAAVLNLARAGAENAANAGMQFANLLNAAASARERAQGIDPMQPILASSGFGAPPNVPPMGAPAQAVPSMPNPSPAPAPGPMPGGPQLPGGVQLPGGISQP